MSDQDFIILDGEDTKENEGSKDTPAENGKKEMTAHGQEKQEKSDSGYEKICFICHRQESVTGKMSDLPDNIQGCPD